MTMFDFVKDLFKKQGKKELATNERQFSFSEIEKWLNENTKEIGVQFNSDISQHFLKISEGITDIESGLKELENFNIEKEMNERAKTMIIQNRDNYIKSTQRLLDFFRSGTKTERGVRKIEDFVKLAQWEIDLFSRQTTRSFHISSSIIGKEFEKVLVGLKKINQSILALKTMDKTKQRLVETALGMMGEIRNDGTIMEKLNSIREDNDQKINGLKKEMDNLRDREKKVKNSREWKQREELKEKINNMEKEQEQKRVELRNLFMNIEKLIQKYAWNRKKKDILLYIEDTISALKEDDGLKILNDLDNIRKDIDDKVYSTDFEKNRAFMDSLNKIGERVLLDFLEIDMKYEDDLRKLREDMKGIKIEEMNYDEINGKIREKDEENLKIEKRKKLIIEEISSKKKGLTLLIEDIGNQIGRPLRVNL